MPGVGPWEWAAGIVVSTTFEMNGPERLYGTSTAILTKEASGASENPQILSTSFQDRPHSRALFLESLPGL